MERIDKLKEFLQASPNDNFLKHALALEYIKTGDTNAAKTLFEEILAQDALYIGTYYHLAKLLQGMGDTATAVQWYEKGMQAARRAGDDHAYNELRSAYEELTY